MVDAGDSKSPAARRAGSIPAPGTTYKKPLSLKDLTAFFFVAMVPSQFAIWRISKKRLAQKPCDDIRKHACVLPLAWRDGSSRLGQRRPHPAMASVCLAPRKPRNFPPPIPCIPCRGFATCRPARNLPHEAGRRDGNVMSRQRVKVDQNTK